MNSITYIVCTSIVFVLAAAYGFANLWLLSPWCVVFFAIAFLAWKQAVSGLDARAAEKHK